jgi:hypothetical protein
MSEVLTAGQRRTARARETFAQSFSTPEARSEHYRQMAEKANAGRVVLSVDEATALADAYGLLGRIAERVQSKIAVAETQESAT